MDGPALQVEDLVRTYGSVRAVDGLSFAVAPGTVTALLGPNGAGKTTTVEICEGFRSADSGAVRVLGQDPGTRAGHARLVQRVGVMVQGGGAYPGARVSEMVGLVARLYREPLDPRALLERLGLSDVAARPWRRLSGGQKQRLGLALAVVGRPELVFLDEPTAGLDVQARHGAWDLVRELRGSGVTVLLTTHAMDEAEALADVVVVVDRGRVVANGSVAELTGASGRDGSGTGEVRFRCAPGVDLDGLRAVLPAGTRVTEAAAGSYLLEGHVDPALLAALTTWAAREQLMLGDLAVGSQSLEDVFLTLTGRELRA